MARNIQPADQAGGVKTEPMEDEGEEWPDVNVADALMVVLNTEDGEDAGTPATEPSWQSNGVAERKESSSAITSLGRITVSNLPPIYL